MKVTVFGAGNMGLTIMGALAGRADAILYTKRAETNRTSIEFAYEEQSPCCIEFAVTNSLDRALESEILLCTYPAFMRGDFIGDIAPLCRSGQALGFVPGYGGAEFHAKEMIERGITIFGLQRVPYVARSNWNNREARVLSAKDAIYVAALPKRKAGDIARMLELLLGIPTVPLKEYIATTLVPSNPLLHTVGLYTLFNDHDPSEPFPNRLKFYEEWSDETSSLLLEFDDELQEICRALTPLDASEVASLRTYYEAPTIQLMTAKLKSIKAFEIVQAPLILCDDGYRIDFENRMFTEDFPFGVAVIKAIGLLTDVATPVADVLLDFHRTKRGIRYFNDDGTLTPYAQNTGIPQAHGIQNLEELISFYAN